MSQEDFVNQVSSTGILTEKEVVGIFQHIGGLQVAELKWKKKRKIYSIVANTFSGFWCYDGRSFDALTVKVSKAVVFHGVRLFGSKYEVRFTIKDKNVTGAYTSTQDNDGVWVMTSCCLNQFSPAK